MVARNATIENPKEQWDEEEKKLVQYNLKPKNIITFALGMDEYFRVSNCKNAKGHKGGKSLFSKWCQIITKFLLVVFVSGIYYWLSPSA